MSLLIKCMKMPKNCLECMNSGFRTAVKCAEWKTISAGLRESMKSNTCPLVELPEKHGRLIDADALIKALIRKEPFNDCARVVIAECMEEVRHAPTVIETEDEG